MRIELVRYAYMPEVVLGLLKFPVEEDGTYIHSLWTVESPWLNNVPFRSCVPDGAYKLMPFDSMQHPESYILSSGGGLEGRSGILIHSGNDVGDTTGCVLPGITRSDSKVWASRDAMRLLLSVLGRVEVNHHLIIGPGLGARMTTGERGRPPEDTPTPHVPDDSGANGDSLRDDSSAPG